MYYYPDPWYFSQDYTLDGGPTYLRPRLVPLGPGYGVQFSQARLRYLMYARPLMTNQTIVLHGYFNDSGGPFGKGLFGYSVLKYRNNPTDRYSTLVLGAPECDVCMASITFLMANLPQ